jgi:hypothetical protein
MKRKIRYVPSLCWYEARIQKEIAERESRGQYLEVPLWPLPNYSYNKLMLIISCCFFILVNLILCY